jgi:hypothetical protein
MKDESRLRIGGNEDDEDVEGRGRGEEAEG